MLLLNTTPPKAVEAPDGTVYRSINVATRAAGVCRTTMAKLLQQPGSGWRLVDAPAASIDGRAQHYGKPPKPILSPDGNLYQSIKAAAAAAGIAHATMTRRCQQPGSGWSYAEGPR